MDKGLVCKCGHKKNKHKGIEVFVSDFCDGCWRKRWNKKYKKVKYADLDFDVCTEFRPDNLKYLENKYDNSKKRT